MLLLVGCGSMNLFDDPPEVKDPSPVIEDVIEVNEKTSEVVNENTNETIKKADEIKDEAKKIIDIVPPESKEEVRPRVDNIDSKADEIKVLQREMQEQMKMLDKLNNQLQITLIDVKEITNQNNLLLEQKGKLIEELAKEKDAKQKALFAKMVYLIIAGIICGAICLVIAVRGEPKAIWGAVGAGIVIIASLSISFYMTQFALVGFVAIVGSLALLGWDAWKSRNERKANKELIHTVEVVKEELMPTSKKKIFGGDASLGQANMIQSKSTHKLVQQERIKMKPDWETIIKKD